MLKHVLFAYTNRAYAYEYKQLQGPLEQTIDICADVLYHNNSVDTPWLPESSFRTLMSLVTTGVEFSFDNVMYRQVDGVAMGSPLGPVLANIFVGYCESLVDPSLWPEFYVRFVDDSFTYFDSVQQCDAFLDRLNNLHPSLKFTVEHEQNNTLSFLDVRVEKSNDEIVTSIYRKPTFTGQYIVFDSYCSYLYKVNLVKNLVDRARRICSPSRLKDELGFLKSVFLKNGYPEELLNKLLKSASKPKVVIIGPSRCPVYLSLPWKGEASQTLCRTIKTLVTQTYFAAHFIPVFTTIRAFTVRKDVLPSHLLSHLVYQFECRNCDSRYVGRTLQHLSARIKQHVPLHMLPDAAKAKRPKRGRPRKNPRPLPPTQPEQVEHTVQRKSGGSLSQPNVPSPPLPLPPPEPPPVPLVAGVGEESATTTVPPITDIEPISLTQYPAVRTPQHPPALDPWVQRPRRSTANYSTEIYARNGQGPRGASKETGSRGQNGTQSRDVDEVRTVTRDRRRKENMDGIRRLTGGEYELGDDAADDENTDDDEADDGEDTDDDEAGDDEAADEDEADDGETAGGDGDKTDEEESGGREGDGADEGEIRKKSAVYLHLLSRPDCLSVYDDSHFSVLCRARYVQQLKVLEAVCIRTHKPDLCKQKEHVLALRLFS